MEERKYPSAQEQRFLELGYNRFLDLFEFISNDKFWLKHKDDRLLVVKELISIYIELIKYEPLKFLLTTSKRQNIKLVGKDFLNFLRNLLIHFPFYPNWDSIIFNRQLITSIEQSGGIDKFLLMKHPLDIKYRIWNPKTKEMIYIEVNLQTEYEVGSEVSLSSIIPEKEGMVFLSSYMYSVLMSQVEHIKK